MQRLTFVIALLAAANTWAGYTITPVEMTYTAIGETMYRIHLYAKAKGKLPANLEVLPKRSGYANSTVDGWDVKLMYRIFDDGTLTLASLGKDQKVGGAGENEDIVSRYRWRDSAGRFLAKNQNWIVEGEIDHSPGAR